MSSAYRRDDALRSHGMPFNHVPRPRAPPQLIRPPSPLSVERPKPIVPDVSLIIDSATTSFQSTGHTFNEDTPLVGNSNSDRFTFQQRSAANRSVDNSGNNSSPHFINYYPTPEQNSGEDHQQVLLAHSNSKTDSGNGSLSESPRLRISKNDTSVASMSGTLCGNDSNMSNKSERNFYDGFESLKSDVAIVLKTVKSQADSIELINSQLQRIIAFQEQVLVNMTYKGPREFKSVQTDTPDLEKLEPLDSSLQTLGKDGQKTRQSDRSGSLQRKRSFVNSKSHSPKNTVNTESIGQTKAKVPITHASVQLEDKKTAEDFSAILRNLQISNVHGPSMYSDTSMRSIDCPPFHEGTFQNENSVDPHYSDLDDDSSETVLPSVTYYNNLLSTVNRILDGGQKPAASPKNPPEENGNAVLCSSRQHTTKDNRSRMPSGTASQGTASYSSETSSLDHEQLTTNHRLECREYKTPNTNTLADRVAEHQKRGDGDSQDNNNAVEATKKYLQSLGIQVDGQSYPQSGPTLSQKQNYMIQQNVYNSIYIPTVNCVPVISDSLNSNSGVLDNLARKYIPSGERNNYEMMAGQRTAPGGGPLAETTVYGMSPGNLSFATKEYLQRHGLVGHTEPSASLTNRNQALPEPQRACLMDKSPPFDFDVNKSDKILDITAIRNQPKLL